MTDEKRKSMEGTTCLAVRQAFFGGRVEFIDRFLMDEVVVSSSFSYIGYSMLYMRIEDVRSK